MELKSFSWDVRSETCAVKTVDFSLLKEGTTGIPQGIAPFFLIHSSWKVKTGSLSSSF